MSLLGSTLKFKLLGIFAKLVWVLWRYFFDGGKSRVLRQIP